MDRHILETMGATAGPLCLVAVAGVRGSAPRHLGAAMLVGPRGRLAGTTGGGRAEFLALGEAKSACADGRACLLEVDMTSGDPADTPLVCGGKVILAVLPVADRRPFAAALALVDGQGSAALDFEWAPAGPAAPWPPDQAVGTRTPLAGFAVRSGAAGPGAAPAERERGFADIALRPPRLAIIGAGHVGRALAAAAAALDYRLALVDDRPDYLEPADFPPGAELRCGPYAAAIAGLGLGAGDAAVVVTRGHLCDLESLRALVGLPLDYLGMIGSARKTALLFGQLRAEGVAEPALARVRAPVGLPIGAETPAEIAVSIVAEMIARRRQAG